MSPSTDPSADPSDRPTAPLSTDEMASLGNLIERGARHLTPAEAQHLLALWHRHHAAFISSHAQRTIAGLRAANRVLEDRLRHMRAVAAACDARHGPHGS